MIFFTQDQYMENPCDGFIPDSLESQTERSGYRSIADQIEEMMLAGERLEDWRLAALPFPDEFPEELMAPTPVFSDQMLLLERFQFLQQERERFRKLTEAEAERISALSDEVSEAEPNIDTVAKGERSKPKATKSNEAQPSEATA